MLDDLCGISCILRSSVLATGATFSYRFIPQLPFRLFDLASLGFQPPVDTSINMTNAAVPAEVVYVSSYTLNLVSHFVRASIAPSDSPGYSASTDSARYHTSYTHPNSGVFPLTAL
jgi:hypothetical protein